MRKTAQNEEVMKLHARSPIVTTARLAFDKFLLDLEQKHDLTFGELFSILGNATTNLAKYQIRAERHPDLCSPIVTAARLKFDKLLLEQKHDPIRSERYPDPSSPIATAARLEFDKFLLDLEQKHDLTFGELFTILGNATANLAKYQIRAERHPDDPDKRGDEE